MTLEAMLHFRGDQEINRAYCDNWSSFKGVCRTMGILREPSLQGVPKTNARIERVGQDQLDGTRTLLSAAGLPTCWSTYAMPCYAMLHNLTVEFENSPGDAAEDRARDALGLDSGEGDPVDSAAADMPSCRTSTNVVLHPQ